MKIYFVGICGVMMAPLSVAMMKQGYEVIGSDKGFYPPISVYLKENNVPINVGYKAEHVTSDIDVAVIGAAIQPNNPEYEKIQSLGIKHYMGYGGFMRDFVLKEHSIVAAGTYGKTTITAFLALVLDIAGMNPSFGIGGIPQNFPDGVRVTDSPWSVLEGDEYINSRIDFLPRFLMYKPEYLLINAGKYDHLDVYKTEQDYIDAFRNLVSQVPDTGLIIANASGENMDKILDGFASKHILYVRTEEGIENPHAYASFVSHVYRGDITEFVVQVDGVAYTFQTKILGMHNIRNMVMGIALACALHIPVADIQRATLEFLGVRRRLEVRKESPYMIIDDLAHSPVKAQSSINSMKERFPDRKLYAVFEPHTLSSRLKSSLYLYNTFFRHADEVLIAPVYHPNTVPEAERVSPEDIAQAIGTTNVRPFDTFDYLKSYIEDHVQPGDIILFMSSGNFGGLIDYFAK